MNILVNRETKEVYYKNVSIRDSRIYLNEARGFFIDEPVDAVEIIEVESAPTNLFPKNYKYIDGEFIICEGGCTRLVELFNSIKNVKLEEIQRSFANKMSNGVFTSALGFNIDCRRDGSHFDKDNLDSVLDLGVFPVQWRDADNVFRTLSETDLLLLRSEMINFGLSLYTDRWTKENLVNSFTYTGPESVNALQALDVSL